MTAAGPSETRAERRAREAAERAEWDHLIDRLRVLSPHYDCFCGTLDDLRETVADLERQGSRDRTSRVGDTAIRGGRRDAAVARAGLRVRDRGVDEVEQDQARREQLTRWHAADSAGARDLSDADAE